MDSPEQSSDEAQRAFVIRLIKAGWVSKSRESPKTLMLQWTEAGREKLTAVHELLSEISYGDWSKNEKWMALLILWMSNHVGWDDDGVTVLGGADLS